MSTSFFVLLFVFSLFLFTLAVLKRSGKMFENTYYLFWLGIFVWGDALVIGPFWMIVSLLCAALNSLTLFGLIVSLFWTIRSLGETMYWIHEQFALTHRNPPHTLVGSRFVKDESIWFLYQTFWQCLTVFSLISSFYFAKLWLQ